MKKSFKYYAIIWAVMLAVYNAVVFSVRPIMPGYVINYDSRFWTAYAFVTVTFIGQLICAFVAFGSKNKEKMFLNIPLITESYTALIVMTVVGSALMLIPDCPAWISVAACAVVLMFSVMALAKAGIAAKTVYDVGQNVKEKTLFIKSLTVDAEGLVARAENAEIKAEATKVYEAVRYSDPMSNSALEGLESQISITFGALSDAVSEGNAEEVKKNAKNVILLINERNKKCKLLK